MKTLDTIINELFTLFKKYAPTFSLVENTVERNIFIEAPSVALKDIYDNLDYLYKIQLITEYAKDLPTSVVDDWAAQYGIVRRAATKSTTTVWFYRDSPPDSDITIPIGTVVATSGSPSLNFITIESKTMYAANPDVYYDPSLNKWGIDVAVESEFAGTESLIGSNLLTNLTSSIAGITSVNNKLPSTGGEEEESNINFVRRVLEEFRGRTPVTYEGIESLIKSCDNVKDSLVIDATHPLMQRDANRGRCVDAYIVGFLEESYTESFTVTSTGVILGYPPVKNVISVIGNTSYTENTDFILIRDNGLMKYSTRALDKLIFTSTGPTIGEVITVTYTSNKVLHDLDSLFDRKENKVPNRDILMREATEVFIDLKLELYLDVGSTSSDVTNSIETALANYIVPKLQSKIEKADIINIVQSVTGVDNSRIISLTNEGGGTITSLGDIHLNETEYPILRTLEFQIV